jgi:hypothetical protein
VEVRRTAGGHEVVSADLAEAARDRDRDGIPDLVERRLLLDPERADSDGDGIPDASDPVPNAAATAEDDLAPVAAAFFEQYFGVYAPGEDRGAIIVISDRALARYGRRGPTLVLTGKEAERLTQQAEKARMPLPPRLSLEPEGAPSTAGRAMPVDAFTTRGAAGGRAGADERALRFTHYVAPLNAAGYQVVMRKIGKRWYVRSFVQRWVS